MALGRFVGPAIDHLPGQEQATLGGTTAATLVLTLTPSIASRKYDDDANL